MAVLSDKDAMVQTNTLKLQLAAEQRMSDKQRSLRAAVRPGRWEHLHFTAGTVLLGSILLFLGAAPTSMPQLYLVLASIGLPWRIWDFCKKGWGFFLIDFCYVTNAAVIAFLLLPADPRWQAVVYVLSEGPLAAALIAWECSWVLSSSSHTTSVLMHLLPGLAMYSRHHLGAAQTPCSMPHEGHASGSAAGCMAGLRSSEAPMWLLVVPLIGYLVWQLMYWLIVQVCCRGLIERHGYDTSYRALSRRQGKANTYLHRLGRQGGTGWRMVMFGGVQLVFTLVTLLVAIATYHSATLATIWQVIKFVVPLYYGARYQVQKATEQALYKAVWRLAAEGLADPAFLQILDSSGTLTSPKQPKAGLVASHKHGHEVAALLPKSVLSTTPTAAPAAAAAAVVPRSVTPPQMVRRRSNAKPAN